MVISYTEAVFLYCLKQINNERSIYSLYHLFQGKKSSQTIQDAHLFNIAAFFQAFPFLSRTELEKVVQMLSRKNFVIETLDEHYQLTNEGLNVLDQFCSVYPIPPIHLAGWEFHHLTTVFWERLTLLVQVCSNLVHLKKGFIPIQNKFETLEWIKSFLKIQKVDRYELACSLFNELTLSLNDEETINPSALVLRLTGHDKIGLTPKQAADALQMEEIQYHLEFLNTLHFLLGRITDSQSFPYLRQIVSNEERSVPFTRSTEKTYELLREGYSLEEIASIRRLKKNTIEDHIVEIALHIKDFDLTSYVPLEKVGKIIKAAQETSSKKLREIREIVSDVSYFEIRLVLARNGDRQWN